MSATSMPNLPEIPQVVQDALQQRLDKLHWYQKYRNTATQIVAGFVTFIWWLIGSGIDLPTWLTITVGFVLYVAGVLGIKKTNNGLTPRTIEMVTNDVEAYVGGSHRAE